MSDLKIKLTTMGKAALVDDANIGTEALKITSFEIGSNYYEPNGSETELQSLIKSMPSISGEIVSDHVIHISLRDETNDEYDLGEIGLRTQNGVLLGIISSEDSLITSKGANDILLIAADIIITEGDVSNITFGDTNFMLPTGTEDKQGIYELATDAEVDEKLPGKVVDGKKLHDAITRRSSSAINSEDTKKLATSKAIHTLAAVIAANKAITDASLNAINAVIQSDNADLDTLNEIAAIITAVKNTQDTLAIGNIAGLQAALNNKTNTGHGHVINDITNLAVTITSLTTAINSKAAIEHNHDGRVPTKLWDTAALNVYEVDLPPNPGTYFIYTNQIQTGNFNDRDIIYPAVFTLVIPYELVNNEYINGQRIISGSSIKGSPSLVDNSDNLITATAMYGQLPRSVVVTNKRFRVSCQNDKTGFNWPVPIKAIYFLPF